jgi:hypothetical protein
MHSAKKRNAYKILENLKGSAHLEDKGVDKKIIKEKQGN